MYLGGANAHNVLTGDKTKNSLYLFISGLLFKCCVVQPDFLIIYTGSMVGFVPNSGEAQEWVEENAALEPYQWLGGTFYGELRQMDDLATIAVEDGLTFEN